MNKDREEFQEERLYKAIQKHGRKKSLDAFLEGIVQEMDAFTGGLPQEDDISLLAVHVEE